MKKLISKVTLSYATPSIGDRPYRIVKVTNDIGVQVNRLRLHVGDYITEAEASELLSEPGIEVTTIPAK